MAIDLKDLIHDAAAKPRRDLDVAAAIRRGRIRRQRRLAVAAIVPLAAVVLAIPPLLDQDGAQPVKTTDLPPVGVEKQRLPEPTQTDAAPQRPVHVPPPQRQQPNGSPGEQRSESPPTNDAEPTPGGGATPTTNPGPDECATYEVWFGAGSAGGGRDCSFHASSPGGYEASLDWSITIHRGDQVITFSSADQPARSGTPSCGPTGTIQPGDFVEVHVGANGRAAAGRSYGKDCAS